MPEENILKESLDREKRTTMSPRGAMYKAWERGDAPTYNSLAKAGYSLRKRGKNRGKNNRSKFSGR